MSRGRWTDRDIGVCERDAGHTETNDGIDGRGTMEENAMRTTEEIQEKENRFRGYTG